MINEFLKSSLTNMLTIFIIAVLRGTILCVLYPYVHHLFPTAAETGVITAHLSWISSVCITWIFGLLTTSGLPKVVNQYNSTVMMDKKMIENLDKNED